MKPILPISENDNRYPLSSLLLPFTYFIITLSLATSTSLQAQFVNDANHPELIWKIMESEHFKIIYHQGLGNFANRVAEAAEEAFGPVTQLYDYLPKDKVRIILKDVDDSGYGVAYYYHNTIEIWATSLNIDFEFRGTKTDWLRNVFTHEFTHLISLQTAKKTSNQIPGFYLQFFGYQHEGRRDDILTGFPNILTSYVLPTSIIPAWYSEGTAQYMVSTAQHDRFDSHRDMILRMATLNETLLTYDEMSVFGAKTGLGFEKVYDHGFALVLYIVNNFGEKKLAQIFRNMNTWWRYDFEGAVQNALGISGRELHRRWVNSLKERYQLKKTEIIDGLKIGQSIQTKGYLNLSPKWSPNGKSLAYLSNEGNDYARTALYILDFPDSTRKLVASGARTNFDWSPDGTQLLFVKRSRPNRQGSKFWDLYQVQPSASYKQNGLKLLKNIVGFSDGIQPNVTRLSHDLRALYPAWSPDGTSIAFIKNHGGSTNLCILGTEDSTNTINYLTTFDDGTQAYTPQWSPDGQQIAFSIFRPNGNRKIVLIPSKGGKPVDIIDSYGTDRDPCWTPDGTGLIFASDQGGIFDLYHLTLADRTVHRLTRVLGGALQPDIHPKDTRIAFTHYGAKGYEIRIIDQTELWEPVDPRAFRPRNSIPSLSLSTNTKLNHWKTKPYKNDFVPFTIYPRIVWDTGKLKFGLYAGSDEALGRQSLFVGGLLSHDLDMDLFGIYEYRKWRPTIFLEAYRSTRHVEEDVVNRDLNFRLFNRTFTLNEINFGLKNRISQGGILDARFIYSRYGNAVDQAFFNGRNRSTLGATYLNGFNLALSYHMNTISRAKDSEINPRSGREITIKYDRFFNFFLRDFKENSSVLIELYDKYFYNQFTVDWNEYLPVGPNRSAIGLRFYGGLIDRRVDNFFDFHLGGLPFMKGYTFYNLEGSRTTMFRAAYRFPLWIGIDSQTGPLYSDQIFGSIYGGIGRAWDGNDSDRVLNRNWKRDLGFQIRYDASSFYTYPTRVSLDVAYGFDTISLIEPNSKFQKSGLKFYFTLLFGFLQSVGL